MPLGDFIAQPSGQCWLAQQEDPEGHVVLRPNSKPVEVNELWLILVALASASLRGVRRGEPAPFTCRKKWDVAACLTRRRCLLRLTSLVMGKMCFCMNFVLACSVCFHVVLALLPTQPVILSHIYMLCELSAYSPDLSQRQETSALLHPCWQLQSGFYICCHLAIYFSLLFKKNPNNHTLYSKSNYHSLDRNWFTELLQNLVLVEAW